MTKYRITSIPQKLPQAQRGFVTGNKKYHIKKRGPLRRTPQGFRVVKNQKNIEEPTNTEQTMVEVQGVEQPAYWNDMQSPIDRGEECPPDKYMYNGECLFESEIRAIIQKENEEYDAKRSSKNEAFNKNINDIRTAANEEHNRWDDEYDANYLNTFINSKKSDKIKPWQRIPQYKVSPEQEAEFKNNFLVHKKNGFVELYPMNIVQDRIWNNGFQADQFKNYWELDPKQVKKQLGDFMKVADQNYTAEVTNTILTRAFEEGIPPAEVIKGLSSKVGRQFNLNAKFEEPTNNIINAAFAEINNLIESLPGVDQSRVDQDREIFMGPNASVTGWENKYYNSQTNLADFINYQSGKIKKGNTAYSDYMDKYGDVGQNVGLTFAIDDRMNDLRAANQQRFKNINISNAGAAANTARLEDYNIAAVEYISNLGADVTKQVLKQALNKAGSTAKGKLEMIKAFQTDPGNAMQKLLEQKTGNKNEIFADVRGNNINKLFTDYQKQATIKPWDGVNENTIGSKIWDVARHPFDYAQLGQKMWDGYSQSYDTRKDIEKEHGVNMGLAPDDTPLAVIRDWTPLQAFNPFKIGSNVRKGYDKGEFFSALGTELIEMGTKRGIAKGLNAIGKGAGFLKPLWSGLTNPLTNAGFALEAPENFSNAYDEFKAGNYESAAFDAALGTMGALPVTRTLSNLGRFRTAGTSGNFGFKYTNPKGKSLSIVPNIGEDFTLGKNLQNYFNTTTGRQAYRDLAKELHPDILSRTGNNSNIPMQKLSKLKKGINSLGPGYTFDNGQLLKTINTPFAKMNLGRFGNLNLTGLEPTPTSLKNTLLQSQGLRPATNNFNLLGYSDGGLIKAQAGAIVKGLQALGRTGKTVARYANIGTIGTANTLAKTLAPIKINPIHIPTFGMLAGERTMIGPFTGSPLNVLPIGSKIADNEAFRYFGDTLDYAKLSKTLNSADGPILRMGKNKVVSDLGQWFEKGARNAAYSSVFGVRADVDAPGSNLRYMPSSGRNGVLIGDMSTDNPRILDLKDSGLQIERRFPFSEKTFPINMDKLRNDEFDWKTQGGNLQSLIERYGYAALAAAGLATVGTTAPQEYLDEYVTNPIKQGYQKVEDLLVNPWTQPKRKKGGLAKAQLGKIIKKGSDIAKLLKPTSEFRSTLSGMHSLGTLPGMAPIMRSLSKPPVNLNFKTPLVPKIDFKDFSDGWLARQELSNLATFGKQPLLNRADFANNEEMFIEKLFQKYGTDPEKMIELAQAEGISPDAILLRSLIRLTNTSERGIFDSQKPFYVPENWNSTNRAALWNTNYGQYKPFGKNLNEYGLMGGKLPISFGTSGDLDHYYFGQIKQNEKFLSGDYNMSPEVRSKIELKLSGLYKKGINQGLQEKGFDLKNPLRYTGYDAIKTLTPNKKGGVVTGLSKKEIDQYIKDGYIIEDV